MKRYVSANFIKASNLILISAGLCIINFLLSSSLQSVQFGTAILAITLLFVTGLLIRKGYVWMKWIFTILVLLAVLTIFLSVGISNLKLNSITDYISDIQLIIQLIAAVILFLPDKEPLIDTTTQSDII